MEFDQIDERSNARFPLVRFFAGHHGQPFSDRAVESGLPAGSNMSRPESIARALGLVGLRARIVTLRPSAINPAVLPCIVFRPDGSQAVLTAISSRKYTILEPHKGGLTTEMTRRAFGKAFTHDLMLVTPARARTESHMSPQSRREGHWFWQAVRQSWPAWVQILVAAACLNLLNLALPIFVMNVYDRVIPNVALVTLWTLVIGVAIALLLDMMLRIMRSVVLETLGRRVDLRVATRLFDQAMQIRVTSRPGGAAGIANTIRDFETVRDFFGSASFVALIDLLFIGIFIAALFFIVGPLAYIPLLAIPIVLIMAFLAQVPLGRSAETAQRLATKRHIVLIESLLGIETIKSLNAEPVMQREWEGAIAASARVNGQTRVWSAVATNGTLLVQQCVSVGIIVFGVYLVSAGQITVGAMIAANILAGRVLSPLSAIAQTIFRAHYARQAMAALNDMMALPRERGDAVASSLTVETGEIAFRNVSFRYPGSDQPALDSVSFSIQPGDVVSVLGRVGSGKSTMGKLLNGLLQPSEGTILISGHAIGQYDPSELRDGVAYLPQESDLFTGTLRENMALAGPAANDAEIAHALWLAGMDGFLAAQKDGLNTFIGEKGSWLSGGQRQGIALARLMLRRPKVLFLDEPTNSMDHQMENAVISRIKTFGDGNIALIFCTHRMSLADLANRFIVLEQGRKVLDGPKAEVMVQLKKASALKAQITSDEGS